MDRRKTSWSLIGVGLAMLGVGAAILAFRLLAGVNLAVPVLVIGLALVVIGRLLRR